MSSEITDNELRDLVDCYSATLRVSVPEHNHQLQGDSRFDDINLRTSWYWDPDDDLLPQKIPALLVLEDGSIAQTTAITLQAKFKPEPSDAEEELVVEVVEDNDPLGNQLDTISIIFHFEHDPEQPAIDCYTDYSLAKLLTVNEQLMKNYRGSLSCPTDTMIPESTVVSDASPIVYSRSSLPSGKTIYQIQAYRFVLTQCGYANIVFGWPESDHTVASNWCWEHTGSELEWHRIEVCP